MGKTDPEARRGGGSTGQKGSGQVPSLSMHTQRTPETGQMGLAIHGICQPFTPRPDCNTAEVPSCTLRTALSAIPFVSDLTTYNDSRKDFTSLPNSKDLSV